MILRKAAVLFFSTFLCAILFNSCTIQKQEAPQRTITVTGIGTVSVPADKISLNFTIESEDKILTSAVENNNSKLDSLKKALSEAGISDNDITTHDFEVKFEKILPSTTNYKVKIDVNVILRNPESIPHIVEQAVLSNVTELYSTTYELTDSSTPSREARNLAIQKAKEAADLIAGASGATVGIVTNIQEDYNNSSDNYEIKDSAGNFIIMSTVTVSYTLN